MNAAATPAPGSPEPARTPAAVRRPITAGYLTWNFISSDRPALVVNPEALPEDVLAWCWAESMALVAAAQVASLSTDALSPGDVAAIFLHRLEPLESMIEHAMTLLASQARAGEEGSA